MARPTTAESRMMEVRRLIKKIWSEKLGRDSKELTNIIHIKHEFAYKICKGNKCIRVSKGKIEDCFSKNNTPERRKKAESDIENELRYFETDS
jgi:hypothetical protein